MSICEERSGQLVCKLAADERAAFQDEIDRLQTELKALEERVAKLEDRVAGSNPRDRLLPTEEDFDKTMSYHGALLPQLHGHREGLRQG